jgi:hypothetical protein
MKKNDDDEIFDPSAVTWEKYEGWAKSYLAKDGKLIYENRNSPTTKLSTADLDMIDYHGLSLPPIDKKSENDIDMGKNNNTHDQKRKESKEQKKNGESNGS